jgi:hypothetical protein
MTDLDRRVAELLREAVPQPPNELDPELVRSRARRRTGRSYRYAPALAAAVVVAVGLGTYFVVQQHPATDGRIGRPPTQHAPRPPDGSAQTRTDRAVARLFDAAPILPAATPVDVAPTAILGHPPSEPSSVNLVSRHGWWTTAAPQHEVLQYFIAHLPPGLSRSGSFSTHHNNAETSRGLLVEGEGAAWLRPAVYSQLELTIEVAPLGSGAGTGIRVDAHAIWLPQRNARQRIPLSVTSVDVVIDRREYAPTVRRTLPESDARILARIINGLHAETPGILSCPMDRGFVDTLTFHVPGRVINVRAEVGGCPTVRIAGNAGPVLGGEFDPTLLRLLDLPRNYGW